MKDYRIARRSNNRIKKAYVTLLKKREGCKICGYNKCSQALSYHHLSGSKKGWEINEMNRRSIVEFHKEIRKCILVCANCHAEIHAGMVDGYEDKPEVVCDEKGHEQIGLF
jgi:hypothetical protein